MGFRINALLPYTPFNPIIFKGMGNIRKINRIENQKYLNEHPVMKILPITLPKMFLKKKPEVVSTRDIASEDYVFGFAKR